MRARRFTLCAVAACLVAAGSLAPYASSSPDGLQRVAAENGFAGRAQRTASSPISGYAFPGVDDPRLATALAGLAGTLLVLGLCLVLATTLRRRRAR